MPPHPRFHGIDRAETDRRTNIAIREISRAGSAKGITGRIMQEFDCSRSTAQRIIRRGQKAFAVDVPAVAAIERERVRRLINSMIEANGEKDPLRLAAIKSLVDLLGLAAPAKAEVVVSKAPHDTIAEYAEHPELMERALQLEEDFENARSNSLSDQLGATRHSGLGESAAHPPPTGNGNGHVGRSDGQPPGCPDAN